MGTCPRRDACIDIESNKLQKSRYCQFMLWHIYFTNACCIRACVVLCFTSNPFTVPSRIPSIFCAFTMCFPGIDNRGMALYLSTIPTSSCHWTYELPDPGVFKSGMRDSVSLPVITNHLVSRLIPNFTIACLSLLTVIHTRFSIVCVVCITCRNSVWDARETW